ncbi:DUF5004 domain-containing protein [Olivibacter sitiensis]|uniref:DUF5004 domain-containing protein n=1 Tax=Olivibacter sitiensis TaxID=376470 RepID=UPI0004084D95|nr:hypothetical protein [Olivibacter sitiensis]
MKINLKNGNVWTMMVGLAVIAALLACTSGRSQQAAVAESFADKRWQLKSMTVSPAIDIDKDGVLDTDMLQFQDECDADDITIFRSDHQLIIEHGRIPCNDDEEAEEEKGEWQYDPAKKTLTITHYDSDKIEEVQVAESQATRLKLTFQTVFHGTPCTVTIEQVLSK